MKASLISGLVILLGLLATACAEHKDRSGLLKGVKLSPIDIACPQTDVPDLRIMIPDGYTLSRLNEPNNVFDKYLVARFSDPDPAPGQIVLTVTRQPLLAVRDTGETLRSKGTIAGKSVTWLETTVEDDQGTFYQREFVSDEILEEVNRNSSEPLYLTVFVAGADQQVVEQLVASVETLKILPARPNL